MIREYLEKLGVPGFRNPKPVVAVLRLSGVIGQIGNPIRIRCSSVRVNIVNINLHTF